MSKNKKNTLKGGFYSPRRGRRAKARLILFTLEDFFAPERADLLIYTP
ncbi:MAG: hypothetical protein FWF68_02540 [Spirochaetes bacterium]|nr:hypothetical protein [Spirochaetota bacterium]